MPGRGLSCPSRPRHLPTQLHEPSTSAIDAGEAVHRGVLTLLRRRPPIGECGAAVELSLGAFGGPGAAIGQCCAPIGLGLDALARPCPPVGHGRVAIDLGLVPCGRPCLPVGQSYIAIELGLGSLPGTRPPVLEARLRSAAASRRADSERLRASVAIAPASDRSAAWSRLSAARSRCSAARSRRSPTGRARRRPDPVRHRPRPARRRSCHVGTRPGGNFTSAAAPLVDAQGWSH